jgi:hypothetical protein
MIEATPLGGNTALYDSVLTGLAELSPASNRDPRRAPAGAEPPAARPGCALIGSTPGEDAPPISRRRALIVLTDGNDYGSDAAYADVLRAALEAKVPYRAGQLEDAWSHATRAQQAGADMAQTFAALRSQAPPPADLEQRLAAPKIAVDDIDLGLLPVSRVADVVLVVNLQPTSRAIRRLLSASKSLAMVPREADPDHLVRIQVRDWSRDSGEVRLNLSLHERDDDRRWRVELRRRLTLNDTHDSEALTTALEPFIRDVEERLGQRDR